MTPVTQKGRPGERPLRIDVLYTAKVRSDTGSCFTQRCLGSVVLWFLCLLDSKLEEA